MYHDVDSQDDSDNASNTSLDKKKHSNEQDDNKNIIYDDDVEYDEVDDLNEDLFHLPNGFGENINNANNK